MLRAFVGWALGVGSLALASFIYDDDPDNALASGVIVAASAVIAVGVGML